MDIILLKGVFTDDLSLFITEPNITLPNLHSLLQQFHTISGLEANYNKFKALNASLPYTYRALSNHPSYIHHA